VIGPLGLARIFSVTILLALVIGAPAHGTWDEAAIFRPVHLAIQTAYSDNVPPLAFAHFAESVRLYRLEAAALKNKNYAEAASKAALELKALDEATSAASRMRPRLRETLAIRSTLQEPDGSDSLRLATGAQLLKRAATLIEEELQMVRNASGAYTAATAADTCTMPEQALTGR
jgi:hypothetical protein